MAVGKNRMSRREEILEKDDIKRNKKKSWYNLIVVVWNTDNLAWPHD